MMNDLKVVLGELKIKFKYFYYFVYITDLVVPPFGGECIITMFTQFGEMYLYVEFVTLAPFERHNYVCGFLSIECFSKLKLKTVLSPIDI